MTLDRMNQIINERVNLMLKDKEINKIFQSFNTENEARSWIINQAVITLIFSPEEREAHIKK